MLDKVLNKIVEVLDKISLFMEGEGVSSKQLLRETMAWSVVILPTIIYLLFVNWWVVAIVLFLWFVENILRTRWDNIRKSIDS